MKGKRFLLFIIAVALILCAFNITCFAESNGVVIYKNDFSAPELTDSTIDIGSGTAEVISNANENFLRCSYPDSKTFRMTIGPAEAQNLDISFKIRLINFMNKSNSRASFYFRSPTLPSWYTLAYQLQLWSFKTSIVCADFYADDNTLISLDDNDQITNNLGLWNNVKVSLRDTRIVVYINGNEAINLTDDTYPSKGGFGFTSYGVNFDLDDVEMIAYSGTAPEPTANDIPIWAGNPLEDEEEDIADSGQERIDILNLGGETDNNKSSAINVVNPNKLTLNSYIAIGLIAALVLMAVSTIVTTLILIKQIRSNSNTEEKETKRIESEE